MNDTYAEWDTIETINAIKEALELFHEVHLIEANEEAFEKFRTLKPDIVFNVSEGFNGISREAQIPAMLDLLGIPYTGSDPLTLTTCLDKSRTKEILSYYGIPNARFITVESHDDIINFSLTFPVIIKPVAEGSSKGIFNSSLVNNIEELQTRLDELLDTYKQPLLIEEFLPGREFTVAIMGNGKEVEVLPIVEINYASLPENLLPIYSYEAKWIADTPDNPLDIFSCPARLDDVLKSKIEKTALDTYKILRCRDWARIDIRLDKNNAPNVIEVNPLPGVLPNPEDNSCYPKAARAAGLSYNEMINKVLYHAAKRHNLI
jgi:D-alanine-D-alanine ligase